ncbi:MAG: hypothetical protein WKF41_09405 [Gaiellaceae bacterium]
MLGLIERLLPDVYPARWGNFEPIRTVADATRLSDVWRDPFFWFSERRQAYGNVFFRNEVDSNIFSSIGVEASSKRIDGAGAVALLKALSAEFEADFGLLHVLGPRELEKPTPYGTGLGGPKRTEPVLMVTHHILKQYIPNLYWATVFGEP